MTKTPRELVKDLCDQKKLLDHLTQWNASSAVPKFSAECLRIAEEEVERKAAEMRKVNYLDA